MGDGRKNIKCSPETFDELQEVRDELDENWDDALLMAADALRTLHLDGESPGDTTLDDIARDIEALRKHLPESTADEVVSRVR